MDQTSHKAEPAAAQKFRTLILEDDANCAAIVLDLTTREGGECVVCSTISTAIAALSKQDFDLYILDYQLPDGVGSTFFYVLREEGRLQPVIMLTAYPHVSVAVELTRDGLFEYLTKPFDLNEFLVCLHKAIQQIQPPDTGWGPLMLAGKTPAIRQVQQLIREAAATPATTILLTGETGTGKDLTARIIHEQTYAQTTPPPPFVCVNCPTIPGDMFEAELFGAEKGAYTGAHQLRVGLVESARGGTIFLDELSEVPISIQAKLLQFIETHGYRRLGSTETRQFTGRVIAASNRQLVDEVRQGRFRADLWYRLDVFAIHLPPLRERQADIANLAQALLARLAEKYKRPTPQIKPKDIQALEAYEFPGNVRELRNLLERSLLRTPAGSAWLETNPAWLSKTRLGPSARPAYPAPFPEPPKDPLEANEYFLVGKALHEEEGAIRRAAAKLRISPQALLRRLKKWPTLRIWR